MANIAKTKIWDAIVVGSGISGGWAAKELAERGLETLVLEAGRRIDPQEDYKEHVLPYELRFRGELDPRNRQRRRVQKENSNCDGYTADFFVDDDENPYAVDDGKPFLWIRGRHLGGRSIMWGRQSYRWGPQDFEANAKEGVAIDWPIRYEDLAPWYDHVEEHAGISGRAEGLSQLPDGKFLPPMPLNCAELHVREKLLAAYGGERVLSIGRTAILTQSHKGRPPCHYCGPCARGCITGSYFSSLSSTLPAAMETGRCTVRPYSAVASVLFDASEGRATGVRVIDSLTHEEIEVRGRLIFLCASALESVRILLNSKGAAHPEGLANSSGVLGRYVMDHTMGGGASGVLDGFLDVPNRRRPNGIYMPRFRNIGSKHRAFLRGYGYQGGAARDTGWWRGVQMDALGAELKQALREEGAWRMAFYGFGECLPREENRVLLDPALKDHLGIPALRISVAFGDNERAMLADMRDTAAEMLEAAGLREVHGFLEENPPGLTIHEMGGARMGHDPRHSVLNAWNQAHDVRNLFVTDGACMTSSACQNPSLTYMALTARAADHAVRQLRDGAL